MRADYESNDLKGAAYLSRLDYDPYDSDVPTRQEAEQDAAEDAEQN